MEEDQRLRPIITMHGLGLIFDTAHKRKLTPPDYDRAHIPDKLRVASIEKIPKSVEYKSDIERYINGIDSYIKDGIGLLMTGPHGGGKSGAATIIACEVLSRGGSALFIEEGTLIEAIFDKTRYNDDYSIHERAESVDLLALDDLGLAPDSPNLHMTETLVKFRIHRKKANVITTNLKTDAFKSRYKTIWDALREATIPIVCSGVNWRDDIEKQLHNRFYGK